MFITAVCVFFFDQITMAQEQKYLRYSFWAVWSSVMHLHVLPIFQT